MRSQSAPRHAETERPDDKGVVRPMTQAQLSVAHYLTRDGLRGFVLDRGGSKPKLQIDGTKDIVELTTRAGAGQPSKPP